MKPYVWNENMSAKEEKDVAYFERNMLALAFANFMNGMTKMLIGDQTYNACGWYPHQGDPWPGWSRVISINNGTITFHVPDDFDLGNLPEIEPNWNGHTTEQKWRYIMEECGCEWKDEIHDKTTPEN